MNIYYALAVQGAPNVTLYAYLLGCSCVFVVLNCLQLFLHFSIVLLANAPKS